MTPHHLLITEQAISELAQRLSDVMQTRYVPYSDLRLTDLAWADAWCGIRPPITPAASNIRWIHAATDGIDQFHEMREDIIETKTLLTHTVGSMPHRIAEFVVAAVLSHVRGFEQFRKNQDNQLWEPSGTQSAMGMTALIVGTGNVGSAIARLLRPFVKEVNGLSRTGSDNDAFDCVRAMADPGDIVRKADIVVVALPNTPQTLSVINTEFFADMSHGIFVNVGRGVTVDHEALRVALDSAQVDHALLDVCDVEPLPAGDWRWTHPRVTIFPHSSGITSMADIEGEFRAAYAALSQGKCPDNAIDLQVWY
ncbi:NAD(P)-dependent oxidoreductase [Trueperella sp. LYQ143]|uniref:NAD(P)-dependent oxidoreductase n=1 Tax=Trueperella sp. LYQ143 TaxID=3391059 RepID=UPI003983B48E